MISTATSVDMKTASTKFILGRMITTTTKSPIVRIPKKLAVQDMSII